MDKQYSVPLKKMAEQLEFQIVRVSKDYEDIQLTSKRINRSGLELAGFYDYFDGERLQIIGLNETAYISSFSHEERLFRFEKLFAHKIPALIICHDVEILPECLASAEKYDISLFTTKKETSELMASSISFLQRELAPRITRHGVFVEVYGEGLLLLGESGIGKSEAAIELLKRGHRLIADDAVEIKRVTSTTLVGTSPDLIRYYIELRGIGVIDVRRIFGSSAVKLSDKIDLVVNLENWREGMKYDRLGTEENFTDILDVKVPSVTIPIKPGRNLAIILEVAATNNKLKKMGFNSAVELTERINKHFLEGMSNQGDF